MNTVILGVQFGDESKGRVADYLAPNFKYAARAAGGANAGHTVVLDNGTKFVTRLLPSAISHGHIKCVLGQGMVIDPNVLLAEIKDCENRGISIRNRLYISHNAHLVMPYHQYLDGMREDKTSSRIGTTRKGIGPTYEDKCRRNGIRMEDLLEPHTLESKIWRAVVGWENDIPTTTPVNKLYNDLMVCADVLRNNICDTSELLNSTDEPILFEGAQGTMLDIDAGTYPYVTSSSTTIGGILTGAGVSHKKIGKVVGVFKAYLTRVGAGPMPTEIFNSDADVIRDIGNEYGSVTKRPRRIGWVDLDQLRHAITINGVDELAMAKMDVLSALDEIKICVKYFDDGEQLRPIYKLMPGWKSDISHCTKLSELPLAAKDFFNAIQEELPVPITLLSVGAERSRIIQI